MGEEKQRETCQDMVKWVSRRVGSTREAFAGKGFSGDCRDNRCLGPFRVGGRAPLWKAIYASFGRLVRMLGGCRRCTLSGGEDSGKGKRGG